MSLRLSVYVGRYSPDPIPTENGLSDPGLERKRPKRLLSHTPGSVPYEGRARSQRGRYQPLNRERRDMGESSRVSQTTQYHPPLLETLDLSRTSNRRGPDTTRNLCTIAVSAFGTEGPTVSGHVPCFDRRLLMTLLSSRPGCIPTPPITPFPF